MMNAHDTPELRELTVEEVDNVTGGLSNDWFSGYFTGVAVTALFTAAIGGLLDWIFGD